MPRVLYIYLGVKCKQTLWSCLVHRKAPNPNSNRLLLIIIRLPQRGPHPPKIIILISIEKIETRQLTLSSIPRFNAVNLVIRARHRQLSKTPNYKQNTKLTLRRNGKPGRPHQYNNTPFLRKWERIQECWFFFFFFLLLYGNSDVADNN